MSLSVQPVGVQYIWVLKPSSNRDIPRVGRLRRRWVDILRNHITGLKQRTKSFMMGTSICVPLEIGSEKPRNKEGEGRGIVAVQARRAPFLEGKPDYIQLVWLGRKIRWCQDAGMGVSWGKRTNRTTTTPAKHQDTNSASRRECALRATRHSSHPRVSYSPERCRYMKGAPKKRKRTVVHKSQSLSALVRPPMCGSFFSAL